MSDETPGKEWKRATIGGTPYTPPVEVYRNTETGEEITVTAWERSGGRNDEQ